MTQRPPNDPDVRAAERARAAADAAAASSGDAALDASAGTATGDGTADAGAPPSLGSPANSDPAELAKFDELASRWWDEAGEFAPLHRINPLRLGWIEARAPLAGRRVLDVGCGGGILAESMARAGADVLGIDLAEASLGVARLHALESGASLEYRAVSAEDCADEMPGEFDVVTCLEMLEHVPDPASVVAACGRLVKPGGHVFFSTLNRNPKSWLFAIVGAEYVLGLLPRGTHDHERFIRPSELDAWCRRAALALRDMTGLVYNPLTRVYRLDADDIDVNYMISTARAAEDVTGAGIGDAAA